MKKLTAFMTKPTVIWCFAALGVVFFIVSAITAIIGVSLGSISAKYWLVLAFACYLGIIWLVLMRILAQLERKQ